MTNGGPGRHAAALHRVLPAIGGMDTGPTSWPALRRAEEALLACLPTGVEMVTLAPVVPLGAHSVLAAVSQDKVLTTIRSCEVAADPASALALEAATRRAREPGDVVRLGALQRVVRAQCPAGPGHLAHFGLFGLVTAGRDRGAGRFERAALAEHLRFAVASLAAVRLRYVQVALTPLSEVGERIAAAVTGDLAADGGGTAAVIVLDHTRRRGRGYYRDLCFKVGAQTGGGLEEIGDGGFTDWTQQLLASRKERLLITGLGVDRLAACGPP